MYISNVNSASMKFEGVEEHELLPGETFTFNSHKNLTLIYPTQGAARYSHKKGDKKEEGDFKKHDVILLNPNSRLDITAVRRLKWDQIELSGILFTSSMTFDSDENLFITEDPSGYINKYIEIIKEENAKLFRGSDLILKKLLEIVMIHILRNKELSIKDASSQVKSDEIVKIQEYIQENYAEKITLDELAELVDINKYYLIRLFKQNTGLSPIDYLIHVRLAEAEKLLATTDITISKIAEMIGFHSPSHFSKSFKESNHCTPSEYRRRYQKKDKKK